MFRRRPRVLSRSIPCTPERATGGAANAGRDPSDPPSRLQFGLLLGAVLGSGLLAAGCGRTSLIETDRALREVDLGVFSRSAGERREPGADRAPDGTPTAAADAAPPPRTASDGRAAAAPPAETAGAGGPEPRGVRRPSLEPGDRVVIDSMVGQVNGRPIFADDFLEPLEDQLLALARTSTPSEFRVAAAELIRDELRLVVVNALFLAEAEAQLSEQERTIGLRGWLRQLEEGVIAGFGGSEEQARRAILEQEGQTLEAKMEGLRDRALIQNLLRERIAPRVIVSWRDIEREYEKREAEFNPPAKVTLARIRLATRNADRIAEVERRLAAGEDFGAVAESLDLPGGPIWQSFEVEGADLSRVEITNPTVREQLAALGAVGSRTESFEVGRLTWWLMVAAVEQPPRRDLYDPEVQRALTAYLRQARSLEEQDRYIQSLLERGIYDEMDEMWQRLVLIAIRRYGP